MEIHTPARLVAFLTLSLSVCSGCPVAAADPTPVLPGWLSKAIEVEKTSSHPGTFEEASYEGKRVFEFIRGDRADTGDEHVLFSEDGKEICKFGGIVGRVTSGSCDIVKITYVRTIYSRLTR
jgi:hypothetical protein